MKTSHISKLKRVGCASILCLGVLPAASAGIIFSETQAPAGTTTFLVRYNTVGSFPGPATTVTGTAGTQRDRYLVDFSSDELLTAIDVQGMPPPYVRATDGSLDNVDVRVRDSAFTSLFINFRAAATTPPSQRYVDIMAYAFDGQTASYRLDLETGNNLFLVQATDATLLSNISITGMFPSTNLWQTRVGGMQDAPVPEPATLLSLGIGLAGMLAARRRRS